MSELHVVDLNGQLLPPSEAAVAATDLGLLYGIGLFETIRAYRGRPFRLQAHLDRLRDSARRLGLPVAEGGLPDGEAVRRLLRANGLEDARLRLTVTGGSRRGEGIRQVVLLTAVAAEPYPHEYYSRGTTVCIGSRVQDSRDPLQGHKTLSYWPRLQALHEAQLRGCTEALWLNEHHRLAEGSISNLFLVGGRTVQTPALDTPVLAGVTRAAVLELCAGLGIEFREANLTVDDLLDADEVFLTNCMMAVVPVVRVERKAVGRGAPGPVTQRLHAAYEQLVARECPTP